MKQEQRPTEEQIQQMLIEKFNEKTEQELRELTKQMNPVAKDTLYRILWEDYMREDFVSQLEEKGLKFDEDDIQLCVDKYVYDGDYDCTMPYWDNLQSIIDEINEEYYGENSPLRCYKNSRKDKLTIIYYNPDGNNKNGQYVELEITNTFIEEAMKETTDKEFASKIETEAKCYLIDRLDENGEENKDFVTSKMNYKNATPIAAITKEIMQNILEQPWVAIL